MAFDFAAVTAPFRMQPGLRRLAPGAPQLTPQSPGDRAFDEKLQVLREWPGDALVAAPDFESGPALATLSRHAAQAHPHVWRHHADGDVEALRLGWRVDAGNVRGSGPGRVAEVLAALPPPWRLTGLLSLAFAEDFAVIEGTSARIPWIAACLPSHWAPADKVGRHFAEVHGPVADNQVLLAASDHLARLVSGDDRWERFVWTVTPCASLQMHPAHLPAYRWPDAADAEALAAVAFFRTERQTFLPVPGLQQAVFTIQVESRPLVDAVTAPQDAQRLHDALASMSDAVLAYRGLGPARDRLLEWLARRTADANA